MSVLKTFALGLACHLMWGCAPKPVATPETSATPAPVVDWVAAETKVLPETLTASGNLTADPDLQSSVGTPISGRVVKVYVNVGDRLGKGDPMALLTSPQVTRALSDHHHAILKYELTTKTLQQKLQLVRLGDAARRPVEEARNEYAAGMAERDVARSNMQLAAKKLHRIEDLVAHGIDTQRELEEARAAYEQSCYRYRQASQQLLVATEHQVREEQVARSGVLINPKILEAETEVNLAKEEIEHTEIVLRDLGLTGQHGEEGLLLRAPRSGVLVDRKITVGQAVKADDELFTVLDPSRLWLWTYIFEQDISKVRNGMTVELNVKAFPGKTFVGRISYLSPQLEAGSRTQKARVVVENRSSLLKTGMFADVRIRLSSPREVVVVPRSSVVREGDKYLVFLRGEDGQPKPQPVVPGQENAKEGWVEIRQGLKTGHKVAGESAYYLQAGDKAKAP